MEFSIPLESFRARSVAPAWQPLHATSKQNTHSVLIPNWKLRRNAHKLWKSKHRTIGPNSSTRTAHIWQQTNVLFCSHRCRAGDDRRVVQRAKPFCSWWHDNAQNV